MKYLLLVLLGLTAFHCGIQDKEHEMCVVYGDDCHAEGDHHEKNRKEVIVIQGPQGPKGSPGKDGAPGTNGRNGIAGKDGKDGTNGTNGVDGQNGVGCSIQVAVGGAVVTCGSNQVLILNGTNGQDGKGGKGGKDGKDAPPSAHQIVEFIDPCGDGPGFDEILIRTASGDLVAYFEQGSNRFLSIIPPGNYRTTDAQACHFTVNNDGSVTW